MFALVLFTDDILHICDLISVSVRGNRSCAKYSDNKSYACRVLAICHDGHLLANLKESLEGVDCSIHVKLSDPEKKVVTYLKAVKELKKNADIKILFTDKSIVSLDDSDSCTTIFSLKLIKEQEDFYYKPSYFLEFKIVHSNTRNDEYISRDTSKTTPEFESVIEKQLKANNLDKNTTLNEEKEGPIEIIGSSNNNFSEERLSLDNISRQHVSTNTNETYTIKLPDIAIPSISFDISDIENYIYMDNSKDNLSVNMVSSNVPNFITSNKKQCSEKKTSKPRIISDEIVNLPQNYFQSTGATTSESSNSKLFSDLNSYSISCCDIKSDDDVNNIIKENVHLENKGVQLNIGLPNEHLISPIMHSTMYQLSATEILKDQTVNSITELTCLEKEKDSDDDQDKDYQLSDNDSVSSDNISSNDEQNIKKLKKSKLNQSKSLNITLGLDKYQKSAPDDKDLCVDSSATPAKKHFCTYCKTFQSKLARHLQAIHSQEDEVKKFIALPPKNKERQEIIATIRKNGDHMFNTDRRFNDGKLLVCRRPNKRMKKTAEDFLPCGNCKGQYARSVIRHHWRKCTKRSGKLERIVLVKGRKVAARLHEKASVDVRKYIFPYMREDEVVRGIRYDELIIIYANKQCQKYGTHQHHYQMIRARLRLLGRFLNSIKEIDNRIETFADIFQPRFYDAAIDAVRIVAGFDQNKRTFEHPAVASNLGTLIKHVGDLLRSEYIKKELEYEQKRVEDFLKLLSEDYGISINRAVAETQTQNNRRKKVILPTTDDIKKLDSFLKSKRTQHFQKLRQEFSYETWKKLAETTLLSLQLFNRRRPGEIERLYLDDFRSYRGIDQMAEKETYNALSQEGKALARRYVRFEIRGKLGRGVPVLIHVDLLDCLNLIIHYRTDAGVPSQNEYLFGLPSNDKDKNRYLRACDLMRKYSIECGAEIPNSLRGTQLRKHIATKCINLNLTDGQVTDLANFMGHHDKIHKDIYRQPVLETDIVKISKILQTAQGMNESEDESEDNEEDLVIPSTSHDRSNSMVAHSAPRRWSNTERTATLSAFPEFVSNGKIPSGKELQKLIDENSCLKGRTVPQLRTWLHTQKKKKL